jgi:hypothetical protein
LQFYNPMTPDELRQQIELQVVEFIKAAMESGSMKEERAQQISDIVLHTLHPGMNFEELYRAIPKLDDNCPELSPLVLPILRDYENTVNKKALEGVVELIRQGQYDAAAKLGKQAINQEIKLEWHGSSDA